MPDADMKRYYAERAPEFDRVYSWPHWQEGLEILRPQVRNLFRGHTVLETACGTGYWTQLAAETAESITAIDYNDAVLEIARNRNYPKKNVTFIRSDAFSLEGIEGGFSAGLSAFLWSHVCKSELPKLLTVFCSKLLSGALMVFIDNVHVEGTSKPISRQDEKGNTYQIRQLSNGKEFEVMKNFPEQDELRSVLAPFAEDISITWLDFFWLLTCKKRSM